MKNSVWHMHSFLNQLTKQPGCKSRLILNNLTTLIFKKNKKSRMNILTDWVNIESMEFDDNLLTMRASDQGLNIDLLYIYIYIYICYIYIYGGGLMPMWASDKGFYLHILYYRYWTLFIYKYSKLYEAWKLLH